MSYNNSSYFFSPMTKFSDTQMSVCVSLLRALEAEFGKSYRTCTYPDVDKQCRVMIISDLDGEELIRVDLCRNGYITLVNTRERFDYIANLDRQFERFWLELYKKYNINKNEYFKKHKIKK